MTCSQIKGKTADPPPSPREGVQVTCSTTSSSASIFSQVDGLDSDLDLGSPTFSSRGGSLGSSPTSSRGSLPFDDSPTTHDFDGVGGVLGVPPEGGGVSSSKTDATHKLVSAKSSLSTKKKSGVSRRTARTLTICLPNCKHEVVREVAKKFCLWEVGEEEAASCHILWSDSWLTLDQVTNRRRYQLVNHFPGIEEICRKDLLSRNLNRMKTLFPNDYDFFPKTWHLPLDLGPLKIYAQHQKNATFICKPEVGCQGQGIFLLKNLRELSPVGPRMICQLYIARPFLIDQYKFDLRIYVLITSVDPLRIFVYNEGLSRFATAKYSPPTPANTHNSFMHLTNYSVNKYSRNFVHNDDDVDSDKETEGGSGSHRTFTAVLRWLQKRQYNTLKLNERIDDVIIKTILSAHSTLRHYYHISFPHHLYSTTSAAFELLGFDILLDHQLKPYVLEVNHSPSYHTDTKLDEHVKTRLLEDTFTLLNLKQRLDQRRVEAEDRKRAQDRLFSKKIHPLPNNNNNNNNNNFFSKGTEKDVNMEGALQPQDQFQYELDHSGGYRLIYPPDISKNSGTTLYQMMETPSILNTTTAKKVPQFDPFKATLSSFAFLSEEGKAKVEKNNNNNKLKSVTFSKQLPSSSSFGPPEKVKGQRSREERGRRNNNNNNNLNYRELEARKRRDRVGGQSTQGVPTRQASSTDADVVTNRGKKKTLPKVEEPPRLRRLKQEPYIERQEEDKKPVKRKRVKVNEEQSSGVLNPPFAPLGEDPLQEIKEFQAHQILIENIENRVLNLARQTDTLTGEEEERLLLIRRTSKLPASHGRQVPARRPNTAPKTTSHGQSSLNSKTKVQGRKSSHRLSSENPGITSFY